MSVMLHACPRCSAPPRLEVPQWWVAQRTSEKRGVRCAFLVGCPDVSRLFLDEIIAAPDAGAAAVRWNAEAIRLFDVQTVHWTDPQRATWRAKLCLPPPA